MTCVAWLPMGLAVTSVVLAVGSLLISAVLIADRLVAWRRSRRR